jgi:hypothetical protein
MSNIKVNESPNHFMVLDAISRGVNNIDKISRVTRLNNKPEIELIINDLVSQRLATRTEKRGFFGNKKVNLEITETGMRLLNAKKMDLEQKMQQVQQWYSNGDRSQMQNYMDSNRAWIPMMLFSGIMNMMFFMSMMSFMGMAMNPMESSMVQDSPAADDSTANADGTQSVADDTNSNSDTGGYDAAGGDGGQFDSADFGGDFSF